MHRESTPHLLGTILSGIRGINLLKITGPTKQTIIQNQLVVAKSLLVYLFFGSGIATRNCQSGVSEMIVRGLNGIILL